MLRQEKEDYLNKTLEKDIFENKKKDDEYI